MSELSAAAAAALGIPEAIVMRSAAARATETGMTVDEVLAAWAGGGSLDAPVPAAAETSPPSIGETSIGPPAEQGDNARPSPAGEKQIRGPSGKPPVLVSEPDRPMTILAGVVGLFVAVLLVGLVGPSAAIENPGARTSAISYNEAAEHGQEIYLSVGCGSCHTQMVRPIVSDIGLGAVTLNDSNQILGTRRIGPDLSDIGSRFSASQIEVTINGAGQHPDAALSGSDLDDLVAYLVESSTIAPPKDKP